MLKMMDRKQADQGNQVDWEAVRGEFQLDRDYAQLGTSQYFASHPRIVREAIRKHAEELDRNPVMCIMQHEQDYAQDGRKAAARYLRMEDPDQIAIVDSTTMGLGTIYTGLNITKGQEILTGEHNYYSQQEAAKRAAERTGATMREVNLYERLEEVTEEEMVHNLISNIRDETRVLGVTWVHSNTGLKFPVSKLAKALQEVNKTRTQETCVLLVVDGVHGFGIETESFDELGCDFLITGCHKWLYGPRGTGIIAGKHSAWQHVFPVIPSFSEVMYTIIGGQHTPQEVNGKQMSPGGFHSMEHIWALPSGFEFAESIGKDNIYNRVHELNRMCKEGLASMPHVKLATPLEDHLSAGIISFEVEGMSVKEVVKALTSKKVLASEAPYEKRYVRFTPGIINSEDEVRRGLDAVMSLKR